MPIRTLTVLFAVAPLAIACGARPPAHSGPATIQAPATIYSPAPEVAFAEDAPEDEAPPDVALDDTGTQEAAATPSDIEEPSTSYHLRRGESLAHFARWAELPVESIADASGLTLDAHLAVGTLIRVPADHARRSRIEMARDAHHERRTEGYLASRGGALTTEFHVVRTGDSAWTIARQNGGLPVWLVEAFNPSLDLENLLPGQAVMLPVTADMVDEPQDAHAGDDVVSAMVED